MSGTNDGTVTRIPNLTKVTLDAVNAAAIRMTLVDGIEPDTIDLPDLITCLARIAESRPCGGDDKLVISLLDLAALALLWSETADGLTALLDPAADPSDERQAERA